MLLVVLFYLVWFNPDLSGTSDSAHLPASVSSPSAWFVTCSGQGEGVHLGALAASRS
jgi:hypothetical protein